MEYHIFPRVSIRVHLFFTFSFKFCLPAQSVLPKFLFFFFFFNFFYQSLAFRSEISLKRLVILTIHSHLRVKCYKAGDKLCAWSFTVREVCTCKHVKSVFSWTSYVPC